VDSLEWLGWTRSLAYKTMAYTGLRFGELRSISVAQCRLDHEPPYLDLKAEHEKARRGARIALPAFLSEELARYLSERITRLCGDCSPFPKTFHNSPLFDLPRKMTRVFDRDLVFAELAERDPDTGNVNKRDEQGRSVDIHSLRHTFITQLAMSGATMVETAKAARHSDPRLTLKVYSHVDLQDLSDAVNRLPAPGAVDEDNEAETVNSGPRKWSPKWSLAADKNAHFGAFPGTFEEGDKEGQTAVKGPKTRGLEWSGRPDSNRRPPAPKAGALTGLRYAPMP
jgi:hypothetical protein